MTLDRCSRCGSWITPPEQTHLHVTQFGATTSHEDRELCDRRMEEADALGVYDQDDWTPQDAEIEAQIASWEATEARWKERYA